jgi:hypothetical protein
MKKSSQKVSKQVNGLSNAEYAQLLTKVAEYRTKLRASASGKSAKDPFKTYGRIFTEPRVNGLRSKYWICSGEASAVIQKYVKNNPTITVGKNTYAVTTKVLSYVFSRTSCAQPSTSLVVKKVK